MLPEGAEKEILAQEELIAKVIKLRADEHPKSFWDRTGVIPAATAILTVLITSVAGYYTQKALRDNENRITNVRDNSQLGLEAARHANRAIAGVLKLNEERVLAITGELASLDSVKVSAIMDSANRLQEDWRLQREEVEMDLVLAFDSTTIHPQWLETRTALDSQVACIERMYKKVLALRKFAANPVCRRQRTLSDSLVRDLRKSLSFKYAQLKH